MTSILGQNQTNQQIFDAFVRSVLDDCKVEYIEQPIEGLLERIESGEGSVNVALNLIAAAHAVAYLGAYFTPIEEPEWTNSLKALKPRIASGLLKCRKILNASCFNSKPVEEGNGSSGRGFWNYAVPVLYGLKPWEEFNGSGLLTATNYKANPFFRDVRLWLSLDDQPFKRLAFERELIEDIDYITLTSWHYFAISDRINDLLEKLEHIEFEEWMTAVDVCSLLMSRAEPLNEEDLSVIWEQPWSFSSEIKVAPTSAEHWAWQFGRVSALWSYRDDLDRDGITPVEFFDWHWPNGLTALSLLCTAKEPYDAVVSSCWHGALFTHGKLNSVLGYEEALDRLHTSHLFWLMRIGFLDGVKRIDEQKKDVSTHPPEPVESDVLLLGSEQGLGKAIVAALEHAGPELGEAIVAAQEAAEREREAQIQANIAERLGKIWDLIPLDSRQQLIEAEFNLRSRKDVQASLNYAIAVETALAEWLPPQGQRDWPQGLGEWEDCISRMTREKGKRHRLDGILRQRFEPKHAAKLAEALDVFREGRKPGAHGKPIPPYALKAKETALGNEQNPSVFELLLKFAKRWRG